MSENEELIYDEDVILHAEMDVYNSKKAAEMREELLQFSKALESLQFKMYMLQLKYRMKYEVYQKFIGMKGEQNEKKA